MFVMVGVDGGERSRDAVALGRRIATVLEAQLLAIYVHQIDELG